WQRFWFTAPAQLTVALGGQSYSQFKKSSVSEDVFPDLEHHQRKKFMTTSISTLERFCRQVRERSKEHQQAFQILHHQNLWGAALSLVRQELDSMIRVIYLLEIEEPIERNRLIEDSINGRHWKRQTEKGKWIRITDREMVDLALERHGWITQVYQYGCNLIHLSDWHDYQHSDPVDNLSETERRKLRSEIEDFHVRELGNVSFEMLKWQASYTIDKIASNLECYVKQLEKGE
ncbi:MAG: hypothetical protein KDE29_20485, partial [Anaerolineales bacterium]|nr:hypothetical protein [Anaerolineales bacterium]